MLHDVYLGLGSNLGDRAAHLSDAVKLIDERIGHVVRQSSFVESKPWGYESQHLYLNAVILCQTEKTPREVLLLTQQIERDLGRTQKSVVPSCADSCPQSQIDKPTYTDRPIDIDILLYDALTVDEPDLKIPHPLMNEREFVMTPLKEVITNP